MEGKTVLYDKNRENDLVHMIAAEVRFTALFRFPSRSLPLAYFLLSFFLNQFEWEKVETANFFKRV